ncbi:MAG: arginine--tRNA ligase [Candidatus Dormibacteraeota bacterium]|nr:arginine--tRNA ligase [Candidatus Dormibacteraeota bacterium]
MRSARAGIEGGLRGAVSALSPEGEVDLELRPSREARFGDYQSSVALKLARPLRRAPDQIAADLMGRLELEEASVEAVSGYLNFRLRPRWLQGLVGQAAADPNYGSSDVGCGQRVQVEIGSVNPTGPLHIGHGRGTILGDTIGRLLAFTGHQVSREYYVNDQNKQARLFAASVFARLHGREPPPGGYTGGYVAELAQQAKAELSGIEAQAEPEAEPRLRHFAIQRMVESLDRSVRRVNVHYDEWHWESELWRRGLPQAAIERLRAGGHLSERAGAVWFSPAVRGWEDADEDRVVIRSDGEPTYFASDLGYLLSRFEDRGFQRVVEVWGADHHGYVPRMKAATELLGLDARNLQVVLVQMVNLKEGKMSKRQGRFVTLDELVDRVGSDAVRYFYLLRSADAMLEFDLEAALSQGNENPVYYAQYAHARLFNVERTAQKTHARLPLEPDLGRLDKPWELAVAKEIARWPETVETAARELEPHRLPHYVQRLADSVHGFYQAGNESPERRMVVPDPDLTRARLELCRAARNTLRIALDQMGVSAPEHM